MAEEQGSGEKSEEATQTRREDFRKRGQVAQTKELATALFLLVGLAAIFALSKFFFREISDLFVHSYGDELRVAIRDGDIHAAIRFAGGKMFNLIAPVAAIGLVISVASTMLQVGFLQVEDALTADPERINPLSGFFRIFAWKNAIEGLKSILKLLLMMAVAYYTLRSEVWKIPGLAEAGTEETLSVLQALIAKLLGGIGVAMVGLAAADYFVQKRQLDSQMMMTKQEVKEEHRSREGDPMIKARIRKVQREVANRRMMSKVAKADVIITNPTHIAVALKYDANLPAPQLVAKGADLVAEKIKELAREHNIPIVENKPLARTIYKTMKLDQVIPRELFVAVAEVLSFVYRLKRKRMGQ